MNNKTFNQMDSQIPSKGKVIIHDLNEVLNQIKDLEPLCAEYLHALQRCESSIIQIAVDVACVCTGDDGEWDTISQMLQEAGMPVPESLESDLSDDSKEDDMDM